MKRFTSLTKIMLVAMLLLIVGLLNTRQVSAQTSVPTEQEAYNSIIALRNEYYEGRSWTNDNYYQWNGGLFRGGYGCAGFAFICSDAAFGDLPGRKIYNVTIDDIHVGDILRINNDSHSVVVLTKSSSSITVAEGNFNASIHWGRTFTAAQVAQADYIITRYPAGTFTPIYNVVFDANGGSEAPPSMLKESKDLQLTYRVPVRIGYQCEGWALTPNASSALYRPGDLFTRNENTTLYAVWSKPTFTKVTSFPTTKTATITIPGTSAYYKIVAPYSGTYTFAASSNNDTYAILYDSNWNKITHNDDGNGNKDFRIVRHLERGKTYYLVARYYLNDNESYCACTGSYPISFSMEADAVQPLFPLEITAQPQNTTIELNDTARFSVGAEGFNVSYQWYYKLASASQFSLWSNKTSSEVSYKATSMNRNGMQVYCVITDEDGQSVQSDIATMTVQEEPTPLAITRQPQNLTAMDGKSVRFSIEAQGDGLTYAWYYKNSGASQFSLWIGRTTAAFNFTTGTSKNGMSVYCVVSDEHGNSVTSNTIILTVVVPTDLAITRQPQNLTANAGESVRFSIEAQGDGLTYDWYFKTRNASGYSYWSGRTTAAFNFTTSASKDGMTVYCIVSDTYGNSVTSNTITLTVNS